MKSAGKKRITKAGKELAIQRTIDNSIINEKKLEDLEERIEELERTRATIEWVASLLNIPFGDETVNIDTLNFDFNMTGLNNE